MGYGFLFTIPLSGQTWDLGSTLEGRIISQCFYFLVLQLGHWTPGYTRGWSTCSFFFFLALLGSGWETSIHLQSLWVLTGLPSAKGRLGGNQGTHHSLSGISNGFHSGSTLLAPFPGLYGSTHATSSGVKLCSPLLVTSLQETTIHTPSVTPCITLARVYSSLTPSWVSQSVTGMYITLPDFCCVDLQRQGCTILLCWVSQGRDPFTLKLSLPVGTLQLACLHG